MKWSRYRTEQESKYRTEQESTVSDTVAREETHIFMRNATCVISILLVLYCILEWLGGVDDMLFFFVFVMFIWLIVPCAILWLTGFVMSWFQKDRTWRWLRWGCMATILLVASTCYSPHNRDMADYMAKTYEKHSADMMELIDYTNRACDANCLLRLEWEKGNLASSSFVYTERQNNVGGEAEIMRVAGITPEELATIRKMVRRCNCIGIEIDKCLENGAVDGCDRNARVLFQRRALCMYSFMLYDKAQLDTVRSRCVPIRYNDSTFFLFEGGAIGPQDWEADYRQKKELKFSNRK